MLMNRHTDAFLICEFTNNPDQLRIIAKGGYFDSLVARFLREPLMRTADAECLAKEGVQIVILNSELVRCEPNKPMTMEARKWLLSLTESFSCSSQSRSSEPSPSSWHHLEDGTESSTLPTQGTFNAASVDGMLNSIHKKQTERNNK